MSRKICILSAVVVVLTMLMLLCSCGGISEIVDHEHNYVERTFKAKCEEDGRLEKICTDCGDIILINVITATGHNVPEQWQTKVEATCTDNKLEVKVCSTCGETVDTKSSAPKGHTPGELKIKYEASCSQSKTEERICTTCGIVLETKVGDKLNHEYVTAEIEGTCAKGEHKLNTCRLCGEWYEYDFGKISTEHEDGGWVVSQAPTCMTGGSRMKICKICGSSLEYETLAVDPNAHNFKIESFPAQGDIPGYTKYTCNNTGCTEEIINNYEANYLPTQIYEMIANATVRIESYSKSGKMQSLGSGFFITSDGDIATNFHVIAGAYSLKVRHYNGKEYTNVTVKGYNIAEDVAIIKIDEIDTSYLKISTTAPKTGDSVYALGSPLGIDDVFTDGVVSNPNKNINGRQCIVFSAPIASGNSGGPLVNSRGEVIGINTQVATNGQNLNFAIMASQIEALDTTTELTVAEAYSKTIKENGKRVLTYYIMLNAEQVETTGLYTTYSIKRILKEEDKTYGRECIYSYSDETGIITISINWTTAGRCTYTVEFLIDAVKDEYTVKLFDHPWSQYTAEGKVIANKVIIDKNGDIADSAYEEYFTYDFIKYLDKGTSSDPLGKNDAKRLIGQAYIHLLYDLESFLLESETELTLETFNFVTPQAYVEEPAEGE